MSNARPDQRTEARQDTRAEPYVRLERVTRKFGDFVAVDDVSLQIRRGEIFCLLGGSGCGKTTLLRMLAGFEQPTSGSIWIDGVDVTGLPPYERPVNMMFQSYALFPHMTVEQNVAFGLRQDRIPRAEIKERAGAMLELVRMREFAGRKPHQLSGGQRQRVALARSLVKRPKLLLLDEPLAALDKKLRQHTQFELINIQETLGVTFVVVTHDQEEAMTLASRIGVMNHGEIIQVGTPTDIYEYPNSRFVADFIGSVNLFEGRLVEDEPDYVRIASDELGGAFYISHGVSAAPGAVVWVALRPEKIQISREQPEGDGDNRIAGVVAEIAYLGDQSVYLVRLASGRQVRVTQPNIVRQGSAGRITWDEAVWLSWDATSPVVVTQ
ncbi:MAG: polyamine ABC transporter ATP-binding protein [Gammaproteobacteria bacterium]|nr:MAG: polyamine ABC transporter ATP-binding protein [Gammaproteobacteria bacterium]